MLGTLRVITLDNFYRCIDLPVAVDAFTAMLKMRAQGWAPDYPENYVPMDSLDFVARHHLFCTQQDGQLVCISGYRTITQAACDHFQMREPHMGIVERFKVEPHFSAMTRLFEKCRDEKRDILSASKVTIAKSFRGDKELSTHIWELIVALLVADSVGLNRPLMLGSGALRFKTEKFLERVGYEPIKDGSKILPEVTVPYAGQIVLMQLERFSDFARRCYEKHQLTLRSRMIIERAMPDVEKQKRAA